MPNAVGLRSPALVPAALLAAAVMLVWLAYAPGLRGGFLFDDYSTLPKLGDYGDINTLDAFERFVGGGVAGPTGRPIALMSFLLDDNGWPSDPYAFKRTNLLLHMLCALLLCWLAMKAGLALGWSSLRSQWLGALAASIWALHPFFVSTTLYVVQRMTVLTALFQLCGLLAHVHLRIHLSQATGARAIGLPIVMAISLGACTLLAFLSKENGALLPALVLMMEATILVRLGTPNPALWRAWKWTVLGVPVLLVGAYVVHSAASFGAQGAAYRGFTITERVLTEGRVLVSYLFALAIPRIESGGLYHDDFTLSKSLLDPPTTLLCWTLLIALVATAWKWRQRWPLWSCATLFFLAGHALESGAIPLELYFEHRNYVPSLFLAIAAAGSILALRDRIAVPIAALAIAALAMLTAQRASLWGNTDIMLLFWAEKQPDSERTQLEAAQVDLRHGNVARAVQRLDNALVRHPASVSLSGIRLGALCGIHADHRSDVDRFADALRAEPYGPNTFRTLELLFDARTMRACSAMQIEDWRRFAVALQENPSVDNSARVLQQALYFQGRAELRAGRDDAALASFAASLRRAYEFEPAMRMVAELASCALPRQALQLLDEVERRESEAAAPRGHREEIAHLRGAIREDLGAAPPAQRDCSWAG